MSKQFSEVSEQMPSSRIGRAAAYSIRIQEVMRYDKLSSAAYPLVMTILRAVGEGYTEEKWQEEQKRPLKALTDQLPDKGTAHADAANRFEQAVCCLKDQALWPW